MNAQTIREGLTCGRAGCPCARPAGNVHCPAHEDTTPSLAVRDMGGKVLVHDHGGCPQATVIDALKAKRLWPETNGARLVPSPGPRREVARYEYVDEDGRPLFEVRRYEPKEFRQFRPDGRPGIEGVRRVLFRLPDVLDAASDGETVYVVEGEKDVLALETLDVTATCNPGGAGSWRDEYSEALRGAHVVIVRDKDEPGRRHAEQVAASLHGVAASVRVVEAHSGKDAADHVAAGYGVGYFVDVLPVEAVERTTWHWHDPERYLDPDAPGDPPPCVFRRTDGAALFYAGQVNALYGESGAMKSWLADAAVAQVLIDGGSALYYDFEANGAQVYARLRSLGVPLDALRDRFRYTKPEDPLGEDELGDLVADLDELKPDLAVIDGVTDAMGLHGLEMNSNKDYAAFDRLLPKRIAARGPAVVLIDHVGRNPEMRRGHALGAQHKRASITGAAFMVELVQAFGRGKHGITRLKIAKDRAGYVDALPVTGRHVADVHFESDTWQGTVTARVEAPAVALDADGNFRPTVLMERVSKAVEETPGLTQKGAQSKVRGKKEDIVTALNQLVNEGYVRREIGSRGAYMHTSARPYRQDDDPQLQPDTHRPPTDPRPTPGAGQNDRPPTPTLIGGSVGPVDEIGDTEDDRPPEEEERDSWLI